MRAAVEALGIKHPASPTNASVTVSVGLQSEIPVVEGGEHRLLELADRALYAAKRDGRNHVRSLESTPSIAEDKIEAAETERVARCKPGSIRADAGTVVDPV